jgi:nucleoside-diphosphate-sugar epimerase
MKKVLVTGAGGFVGRHLCQALIASGFAVTGTTRSAAKLETSPNFDVRVIGDIGAPPNWEPLLSDVDFVVHLAARVHVMREASDDPLAEFRRVNCQGSINLAKSAAAAGIKRLVYVSTIKVLGEKTDGRAFCETDVAAPCDPYAISKMETEVALQRIAAEQGLEIVILRPPLIYGPGVAGNFLRLLGLVSTGVPLPLGMIRNSRSMLAVSNLSDVIQICLECSDAVGKTFLVADAEETSTPALFKMIGDCMGKPVRLLPVPERLLRIGGKLIGRSSEVARLCDSLQIDSKYTRDVLNWTPRTSLEEGIRSVVRWYSNLDQPSNE